MNLTYVAIDMFTQDSCEDNLWVIRRCFCGLAPELQGEPATREHYNFSGEKPGWDSKTSKKVPPNRRQGHIAILYPAQNRQESQYLRND